jgi:hypothetical protein
MRESGEQIFNDVKKNEEAKKGGKEGRKAEEVPR